MIQGLISEGIIKVGFYFEEMQENLTILYFLRLDEEKHVVLGLDPKEVSVSISNVNGIFRLNDEQYVNLLKIPHCWVISELAKSPTFELPFEYLMRALSVS